MRPLQHQTGQMIRTTPQVPVGSIIAFAGPWQSLTEHRSEQSEEWLPCDGSTVGRARYPELFSLIGTLYGVGDGTSTFTLPVLSTGKFLVGAGGTGALAIGATTGTASATGASANDAGANTGAPGQTANDVATGAAIASTVHVHATTAHPHTPPNVAVVFLIRAE